MGAILSMCRRSLNNGERIKDMMSFLEFLENSGFAIWVREANTVFAYPTVLALHTFGMIFLVGISAGIALRTLGFAPGLPLAPLERFFPLMWLGFWVNVVSGVVLLLIDARHFLTVPDFYIKMLAIAFAVTSVRLLRTSVFDKAASVDTRPVPMKGKILAGTSLLFWVVAITAGRLTAYDGFIQRETAVAVLILTVVMLIARYIAVRLLNWNKPVQQRSRLDDRTAY